MSELLLTLQAGKKTRRWLLNVNQCFYDFKREITVLTIAGRNIRRTKRCLGQYVFTAFTRDDGGIMTYSSTA